MGGCLISLHGVKTLGYDFLFAFKNKTPCLFPTYDLFYNYHSTKLLNRQDLIPTGVLVRLGVNTCIVLKITWDCGT